MSQTKSQKLYTVRLRLPGLQTDSNLSRRRDVRVKAADNITAQARALKRNTDALGIISCVEGAEAKEEDSDV